MKKRLVLPVILALLFCAAQTARPASASGADRKKLTLMVYMCGSNLESRFGSASADIQEMLDSGFDSDEINLLVMTGGSEKWAMGFGAGETTIHQLSRRGRRAVWPGRGEAGESLNMGDPATLEFFMEYCRKNFPAREYALILWDHGGGPMGGVCWDELHQMDHLSVQDVAKAVRYALSGDKLSWIGFDACLMSSLEVACTLAPYAEYMIASQETEPAHGWNYVFLKGLENDENGGQTGRRIVDAYFEQEVDGGDTLTLSCVDLSRIGEVSRRMDPFFEQQALLVSEELFPRLSSLRMQSRGFGKADVFSESIAYDLVDLADLVTRLDAEKGGPLLQAVQSAVVCARASVDGACGLSVYHPFQNKQRYMETWRDAYTGMEGSPGYAGYIFRFGSMLTSDEMIDWGGLRTRLDGKDEGGYHLSCPLSPDQAAEFVSGRLLILTGSQFNNGVTDTFNPIGTCPAVMDENGVLHADYTGRSLYAVAGEGEEQEQAGPLGFYETGEADTCALPVILAPKEGDKTYVQGMLYFRGDPSATEPEVVRFALYDEVTGMFSGRIPFRPEDYAICYFPEQHKELPRNHDRGTLPAFRRWTEYTGRIEWTGFPMEKPWSLRYFDLQTGDRLYAVFEVTDARQNTYCSYPAELPNSNLTEIPVRTGTLETETCDVSLSARLNHSPVTRELRLSVTVRNRCETQGRFTVDEITLNGRRRVSGTVSLTLEPGEEKYQEIDVAASDFALMEEVHSVRMTVTCIPGEDWSGKTESQISFDLEPVDVTGIAPTCRVLAEAENESLRCRLLSLYREQDGDIICVLCAESRLEEQADYAIALNGIQVQYASVTVRPACEQILYGRVHSEMQAGMWDSLSFGNVINFNRSVVVSEDLLRLHGCREIETVTLARSAAKTSRAEPLILRLSEPWPVPDAFWRNEEFGWYGALDEAKPEAAGAVTLIDRPDYAIYLESVFAADNGAAFQLALENRTDLSLEIRLDDVRFNDRSVGSYWSAACVLPHSTYLQSLAFATDMDLPDLTDIQDFSFSVAGPPQGEAPWVRVRFAPALSLGSGVLVKAGGFSAECAPLPEAPEPLPLETGVWYRTSAYRPEGSDAAFERVDGGNELRLILYADGIAVFDDGVRREECVWGILPDGRILAKRFFEAYIERREEQILLTDGSREYLLEPV